MIHQNGMIAGVRYKTCRSCWRTLPATREFFPTHLRWFASWCHQCNQEHGRAKHLIVARAHYRKHREKYLARAKQRSPEQRNKEHIAEAARRYRETNQDKVKAYRKRRWRQKDRRAMLLKKYRITEREYQTLYELQHGVCAICHEVETHRHRDGSVRLLVVDHDHATGKVRGLLCATCNLMLANARDNPTFLKEAVAYLLRALRS